MGYSPEISSKCFGVLVSINSLKHAYFYRPSKYFDYLEEKGLVTITVGTSSRCGVTKAAVTEKGNKLLSRYTPIELVRASLSHGDILGAVHYVHTMTNMEQLPEFLIHKDELIRTAAKYRVRELVRGEGVQEPIASGTLMLK